jgi:DeoR/GlpR family transcriptional regulator of sugar metabolism
LTVITYGLSAIRELTQIRGIHLMSAGGEYLPKYDAFVGLLCEQALAALRANVLFMSVAAVSGNYIFQPEEEFVKLKRIMLASAEKRVLLIDHTKLEKVALHRLAALQEFDHIITDAGIDEQKLKALKESHIPIEVAPLS